MLFDLPAEVTVQSLSNLRLRDLMIWKRLNKTTYALIQRSPLLQYLIEAQVAGVIDNPESTALSIPERMDRLKRLIEPWSMFYLQKQADVSINNLKGIYRFRNGIFSAVPMRKSTGANDRPEHIFFASLPNRNLTNQCSAEVQCLRIDVSRHVLGWFFSYDVSAIATVCVACNFFMV